MTQIDLSEYNNGWKPKFNKVKFDELMENTPTNFIQGDKIFKFRRELIKTLLVSCGHLNQDSDLLDLCAGNEGSGKSHLSFQLAYVKWKLLTELNMINYPFTLDLIYYNVEQVMEAFDTYAHIPYMIYILDESDSLSRNKWNDPLVKKFISKLRKERKNLRLVTLNMPQLSELLPTVTLTRVSLIYEVKVSTKGVDIIRGNFNLFSIPRGSNSWSEYNQKFLNCNMIKNVIARKLYSNEDRYFNLPSAIMSYQGTFNALSPIDQSEYRRRAQEANKEDSEEETPKKKESKKAIQDNTKHDTITTMRAQGMNWGTIGAIYESTENNIQQWHRRFDKRSVLQAN